MSIGKGTHRMVPLDLLGAVAGAMNRAGNASPETMAKVRALIAADGPELVTLLGEKEDGSRDVLGAVPMPPKMKAREIARSYFGESSGEGDDADMCLGALEELHEWMLKQGWRPPPMTLAPNAEVMGGGPASPARRPAP